MREDGAGTFCHCGPPARHDFISFRAGNFFGSCSASDYSKDKGDDEHKLAVESLNHLLGHAPKRRRGAASLQDGVEQLLWRIGLLKKMGAVRNVGRAVP